MCQVSMAVIGSDCPLSGVVVCRNEARYLRRCLTSLSFCDELILVDLESSDGSRKIGLELGARVLSHEPCPIRNRPLFHGISQATHPWIVNLDPDEVFPDGQIEKVQAAIRKWPKIRQIRLPFDYYLGGRRVTSTVWGRESMSSIRVVHRDRVKPNLGVHKEFQNDEETLRFSRAEFKPVRHDWADSYSEIVSKERRYLALEGERRYSEGLRFSWARALYHTLRTAKINLFDQRGLLGGVQGLALSGITTWMVWSRWQSLRRYEKGPPG